MNNIFDAKFGEIKDSITNNSELIESNKTRLDTHLLNYGVFKQDVEEGKYNSNAGNISSMPSVVAPDISVTGNSLYTFFDGGFVDIPFINNGGAATKWTIEPAIGNGLTFDTSTGNIRGTAIGTLPVTVYSITAENSAGLSKTTIQLDILDKSNIITTPRVKTPQDRITEINAELVRFRGRKKGIEVQLNQMGSSIKAFCSQQRHYSRYGNSKENCEEFGRGMYYGTKNNLNNQIQYLTEKIRMLEIEKNELENQNKTAVMSKLEDQIKTTVMSNTNPSITQLDINNTIAAPAPETAMGVPAAPETAPDAMGAPAPRSPTAMGVPAPAAAPRSRTAPDREKEIEKMRREEDIRKRQDEYEKDKESYKKVKENTHAAGKKLRNAEENAIEAEKKLQEAEENAEKAVKSYYSKSRGMVVYRDQTKDNIASEAKKNKVDADNVLQAAKEDFNKALKDDKDARVVMLNAQSVAFPNPEPVAMGVPTVAPETAPDAMVVTASDDTSNYPTKSGKGYYPTKSGRYYPTKSGKGYYPTKSGKGYYPTKSGKGYYPTKSGYKLEGFTNYNNTKQGLNHFQGVNVNKISQLSGSEFQSDKKELVLDLEKDETGHMMSFLLQQNNMNKQVGKKELEEALEKDTEKVVETEGFSNYKSVELDPVSTFYVGSLSVIMLYYIYRSLRK
jgi:hypothetical protein